MEDKYYGLLTTKPVFQGNSQYCQPFNYEVAGRKFRLIMDKSGDFFVNFLTGHILEWGEFGKIPKQYYYECLKGDEMTYFINWELDIAEPRICLSLILDMEQRLVTLNKTSTNFSEKYWSLDESEFDFGVIVIDGYPLPKIRHGYTADLVGKRIIWNYSPDFRIIHVYYDPYYIRADFLPGERPVMTREEEESWANNPYDEKASYIKVKRNMYALNILEQNMAKRGAVGNTLFMLMDLARLHDVGRSFGYAPATGKAENYLFSAFGEFVKSDGKLEAKESIYLSN
jgi:hypothetical protein